MDKQILNRLEAIVALLKERRDRAIEMSVVLRIKTFNKAEELAYAECIALSEMVVAAKELLEDARSLDAAPQTLCVISEAYHDYDEEIFNPLGIATSIDDAKSLVERAVAAGATTCGFEIIEFKDAEAARMHGYFEHKCTDAGWLWETANLNCGELALTWKRFLERVKETTDSARHEPSIAPTSSSVETLDKAVLPNDPPGLMIPLVHLNGTRGEELAEQNEYAYQAMRIAIEQLIDARPNARDYYPRGEAAYPLAMAQHRMRLAALEGVRRELGAIRDGIASQNADRKKQRGEK